MRWITNELSFSDVLSTAKSYTQLNEHPQDSRLRLLFFDSSRLCTRTFLDLLQTLMKWSEDGSSCYVVTSPDPLKYYWTEFKKYPSIEVNIDDLASVYLSTLDEDPGGSPADAIGINWSEYVIFPPSKTWFIRGRRDNITNRGGHLWIPSEWVTRLMDEYNYLSL